MHEHVARRVVVRHRHQPGGKQRPQHVMDANGVDVRRRDTVVQVLYPRRIFAIALPLRAQGIGISRQVERHLGEACVHTGPRVDAQSPRCGEQAFVGFRHVHGYTPSTEHAIQHRGVGLCILRRAAPVEGRREGVERFADELLQPIEIAADQVVAVGADVIDQDVGEHLGARDAVRAVVHHRDRPHLWIDVEAMRAHAGARPVAQATVAFVGRHAVDELDPAAFEGCLGVDLEDAEVGDDAVSHFLEREIPAQAHAFEHARHQCDIRRVLLVGKARQQVRREQPDVQPAGRSEARAQDLGAVGQVGQHVFLAGVELAVGRDEFADHQRQVDPGRALDVLVVGKAVGDGGDVIAHPVVLQHAHVAGVQPHAFPQHDVTVECSRHPHQARLFPNGRLVVWAEQEHLAERAVGMPEQEHRLATGGLAQHAQAKPVQHCGLEALGAGFTARAPTAHDQRKPGAGGAEGAVEPHVLSEEPRADRAHEHEQLGQVVLVDREKIVARLLQRQLQRGKAGMEETPQAWILGIRLPVAAGVRLEAAVHAALAQCAGEGVRGEGAVGRPVAQRGNFREALAEVPLDPQPVGELVGHAYRGHAFGGDQAQGLRGPVLVQCGQHLVEQRHPRAPAVLLGDVQGLAGHLGWRDFRDACGRHVQQPRIHATTHVRIVLALVRRRPPRFLQDAPQARTPPPVAQHHQAATARLEVEAEAAQRERQQAARDGKRLLPVQQGASGMQRQSFQAGRRRAS